MSIISPSSGLMVLAFPSDMATASPRVTFAPAFQLDVELAPEDLDFGNRDGDGYVDLDGVGAGYVSVMIKSPASPSGATVFVAYVIEEPSDSPGLRTISTVLPVTIV